MEELTRLVNSDCTRQEIIDWCIRNNKFNENIDNNEKNEKVNLLEIAKLLDKTVDLSKNEKKDIFKPILNQFVLNKNTEGIIWYNENYFNKKKDVVDSTN